METSNARYDIPVTANFLSNQVMTTFLKQKKHYLLLSEFLEFPNEENKEKLDQAFKKFFVEIRLIKYISSLIHYYSIGFDQKQRKDRERNLLILDRPNEDGIAPIDLLAAEDTAEEKETSLLNLISDEKIAAGLKKLTKKELYVLNLFYVYGHSDTIIAKHLGVSQQSISKMRKRGLEKLRHAVTNRVS